MWQRKVSQKLNFFYPDLAEKMRKEAKIEKTKNKNFIKDLLPTRQILCLFCYDIIHLNVYGVMDVYRLGFWIGYEKLCYIRIDFILL